MAENNTSWGHVGDPENNEPLDEKTSNTNPMNETNNEAQNEAQTAQTQPLEPVQSAENSTLPTVGNAENTENADEQNAAAQSENGHESAEQPTQTMPNYRLAPEFGAYADNTNGQPAYGQYAAGQSSSNNAEQGEQGSEQNNGQQAPTQPFPFGFMNPVNNGQQGQQGNGQPFGGQPVNGQPAQNGRPDAENTNPYASFPFGAPNAGAPQGQQGQSSQAGPQGPQGPQNPFGAMPGNPAGMPIAAPRKTASNVVVAVVAALVSAALCLGVGYMALTEGWVKVPTTSSLQNVTSNKSGSGTAKAASGESVDWTSVASSVSGSVVSIQAQLSNGTAAGSGAILDEKGDIVTNNHVISGAQNIQVTLSNGQMYTAQIVGTDTTTDLAVIKLDNPPSDLKPVTFADSDKLAVGEAIMAIGNPLGYDDTATTGIVSALNRPVSVMDDSNKTQIITNAVQIDAAVNPGNSGGPTFNAAGEVIGINSSIASTATSSSEAGSIGIGFAIPANLVKRVANEIIENGSVKHVALGVTIQSATVEADGVVRGGAKIVTPSNGGTAVVEGSPAAKAGLKADDTIVAFNGNAVNNNYSLLGFVRAAALGDKVTLTIVRGGKTMDVDVTLDQEEAAVNGTNRSENNRRSQNQQEQGDGSDDSQDQGGTQDGQGQNGNGDDGGIFDPFGLW